MKTTLCLALTSLIFVTVAFVPNSFAQETSPKYVLRQIYFYPSDREPSDALEAKLDTIVKEIQQFYADEMERHGFGRKTFTLETDENGRTVKHRVKGKFPTSHYIPAYNNTFTEIEEYLDIPKFSLHFEHFIFHFVDGIDNNIAFPTNNQVYTLLSGGGGGGPFSGRATLTLLNSDKATEDNYRRAWYFTAHELGHAFGLPHDFRDNRYLMSYGGDRLVDRLSYCTAKWLDAHRYFNTTQNAFDEVPTIQMLEPAFVSSPNTIRLRFEITHTASLHQALLLINSTGLSPLDRLSLRDTTTHDCKSLSGNSATIEFDTIELVPDSEYIVLYVIDEHGNYTSEVFQIDMTSLLPDTAPEPISIPDVNLEAAIRENLKLAQDSSITNLDMLNLLSLAANSKQITDLTGLEHATYLKHLNLNNNQIVEITPLTELKNIRELFLGKNQITDVTPLTGLTRLRQLGFYDNQISDITPLAKLTDLHELDLSQNQISDITPLAELMNVYQLYLFGNQISDITSLAKLTDLILLRLDGNQITDTSLLSGLVNLEWLTLVGNPIKNRNPLLTLLRKNPVVEIYLKWSASLQVPSSQLPEDVNADGVVNILDLTLVASNFGEQRENIADVNGDETVNILDLVQVASAFGNTAPTL